MRSLHWLPVRRRVTFKFAVIAWKCVNGVAPTYLRELCVPMEDVLAHDCGSRQLTAFYCLEFRPLLDSGASRTADLQCATVCPPALRENMSLATFKTKLKTYLFRRSQ